MNPCQTIYSHEAIRQDARIAIWGKGGFGEEIKTFLADQRPDVTVVFFLDSYEAGTAHGLPVHTPDLGDDALDAVDLILVASTHHEAITAAMPEKMRPKAAVADQSLLDEWRHAQGRGVRFRKFSMEISRSCDMDCEFCNHQVLPDGKGHMPLDRYADLIRQIAEDRLTGCVIFAGVGEPLCHPQIVEAVAMGTRAGLSMEICSNGLLLTPDKLAELSEAGLKRLHLSVHTLTPSSFALRRAKNSRSFEAWYANLLACFRQHAAMDMDMQVSIRLMYSFPEWDSNRIWGLEPIEQDTGNAFHLTRTLMEDIREIAEAEGKPFTGTEEGLTTALQELRETGCDLTYPDLMPNFQFNLTKLHLSRPEEMRTMAKGPLDEYVLEYPGPSRCRNTIPLVVYNGDLLPCCTLTAVADDHEQLKMGNCFETSLAECFAADKFRRFDSINRLGKLNWRVCGNCRVSYVRDGGADVR